MQKKVVWAGAVVAVVVFVAVAFALGNHKNKTNSSGGYSSSSGSNSNGSANTNVNNSVLTTKTDPSAGQYLADSSGKALYTYGSDSANTSNCTSSCLANWPAYADSGATTGLPANVGVITRSDNGKKQYTYKHMPLYYFAGDTAAGQVTGDGVGGFSVARP